MATSHDRVGPRVGHARGRNGNRADRVLKAFTHPLRVAILARLDEDVLSPKELAGELRASLPVVSYHVRELERTGLIELVRTAQRRGAVQHWYRAKASPPLPDRKWSSMSARSRRELVGVALARLEAAVAGASEEGGFDRAEVQLSRELLTLDERGFEEVAGLLGTVRERLEQITSGAQDRLAQDGGSPLNATLVLMLFEGPYGKRRKPRRAR